MEKWRLYVRPMIGAVIGAILGYAYYYFIGCSSGSCAISSNPLHSTLYFALLGVILLWEIPKKA